MKSGAPYVQFATKLLDFLEDHDLTPMGFHNDLRMHMGADAPSSSTVYMTLRGQRLLPMEVVLFMQERYGFKLKWRYVLPLKNKAGARVKSNDLTLPFMREVR
jgi:hypothetical protein